LKKTYWEQSLFNSDSFQNSLVTAGDQGFGSTVDYRDSGASVSVMSPGPPTKGQRLQL
jgi:hypothetical protein